MEAKISDLAALSSVVKEDGGEDSIDFDGIMADAESSEHSDHFSDIFQEFEQGLSEYEDDLRVEDSLSDDR